MMGMVWEILQKTRRKQEILESNGINMQDATPELTYYENRPPVRLPAAEPLNPPSQVPVAGAESGRRMSAYLEVRDRHEQIRRQMARPKE